MSEENEQAQFDELEQEEQESSVESEEDSQEGDESEDETVTISKADYKKLGYKARAYDATIKPPKKEDKPLTTEQKASDPSETIKIVTAVQGLASDEIDALESEASDLGVPLLTYIKSTSGKTFLNSMRQAKKAKEANPSLTSKTPIYKKHTTDDLSKMSSTELAKILPHDY